MSEILNLEAIEQQRILITVSLTGSDGAPVSPSDYVICAAAIGQPNPYTQRAVRKEWAASINNENSAFLLTCPGLDMSGAPWKYRILLKNRALELEWQIVSGRISLTPRACGTDGISPASYSVACEATPSGLVNVTLDATVGSISGTLEEVKASAAAAAAAAQNAHADLEDAETAATKASQAALAAAADARIASDKATAAEAAATAAPEACKPYVQQVQQAAAAALDASRAATTAAAGAQASADAAAPAQGYATRAESAQAAAVQAAADATTAATTATQQAEAATAQAESARLAATTATTASDNAQAAATRAEDAATRAEAATPAATRAEAARDAAEAAAATATTAAADVPGLVQSAEAAATASEAAQTAAETAQSTAETAASTATAQAEAAAASAAQADTDARACALYDQRVSANATSAQAAAATASTASDDSEAAATRAEAAAATATEAATLADYQYAEILYSATKNYPDGVTYGAMQADGTYKYAVVKNVSGVTLNKTPIIIVHGDCSFSCEWKTINVFYSDDAVRTAAANGYWGCWAPGDAYLHAPNVATAYRFDQGINAKCNLVMSPATRFDKLTRQEYMFSNHYGTITFAAGTTFSALVYGAYLFADSNCPDCLPDEVTFESVTDARDMFRNCGFTKLPKSMNLSKCVKCSGNTFICRKMEIDDIVRVCLTLPDLTALETPTTSPLGIANNCMHNGKAVVNTQAWLNANYPDFILTLNARGWTVTFA